MRRGEGDGLGALFGNAVRGNHQVPAVLLQAREQRVKANGFPLDLQAHFFDHQLGHFNFKAGQRGALEVVERGKLALGRQQNGAVFLDGLNGAGLDSSGRKRGAHGEGGGEDFEEFHGEGLVCGMVRDKTGGWIHTAGTGAKKRLKTTRGAGVKTYQETRDYKLPPRAST